MKQLISRFALIAFFLAFPVSAGPCDIVFQCQKGICEKVDQKACAILEESAPAVSAVSLNEHRSDSAPAAILKIESSEVASSQPEYEPQDFSLVYSKGYSLANPNGYSLLNPHGYSLSNPSHYSLTTPPKSGCAENGSCYGDISSINGMPKTIHVEGYYRQNGTYVRGHYRSRGRH